MTGGDPEEFFEIVSEMGHIPVRQLPRCFLHREIGDQACNGMMHPHFPKPFVGRRAVALEEESLQLPDCNPTLPGNAGRRIVICLRQPLPVFDTI